MKYDYEDLRGRIPVEGHARNLMRDARKLGNELVGLNPLRADSQPGSFSINLRTGEWADFATGDRGRDIISFHAYLRHGGDNGAAYRDLVAQYGDAEPVKLQPKEARPIIMPVPAGVAGCPAYMKKYGGKPSRLWDYRDEDGNLLMHVARYDPAGARKQIVPWSWDGQKWNPRGITGDTPRPLYGLDRLGDDGRPVIIVEGEKAADAGQALLGPEGYAVVAWLGGSATAGKVNVQPLAGRVVILWPDRDSQRHTTTGNLLPLPDQPGIAAMRKMAESLRGIASEVAMVGYDLDGECDGWDIADGAASGWTRIDARKYLKDNTGSVDLKSGVKQQSERAFLPWESPLPGFGFPDLTDKGSPLQTVENLAYLCQQYGITTRYNQVKRAHEVAFPFHTPFDRDERLSSAQTMIVSRCAQSRMPVGLVPQYLALMCASNPYNPVRDWIESKPWDGISRLGEFFDTVKSESPLKERLMLRWCIAAIAAIYAGEKFEAHGVLVFVGAQGLGKTRWAKKLVGPLSDVVLTGSNIKPDEKDSVIRFTSHWIVELGELDGTFRKSDIASIKAFITQSFDVVRLPYARAPSELQRRTVAFASVNEPQFLVDDTGNRRWWVIPVTHVDYMHTIDMQQVWAEVKTLYDANEQWHLTDGESAALNASNAEFEPANPLDELIRAKFEIGNRGVTQMTATAILISIGMDRPRQQDTRAIVKVLRKLGLEESRTAAGRFFLMPPAKGY